MKHPRKLSSFGLPLRRWNRAACGAARPTRPVISEPLYNSIISDSILTIPNPWLGTSVLSSNTSATIDHLLGQSILHTISIGSDSMIMRHHRHHWMNLTRTRGPAGARLPSLPRGGHPRTRRAHTVPGPGTMVPGSFMKKPVS